MRPPCSAKPLRLEQSCVKQHHPDSPDKSSGYLVLARKGNGPPTGRLTLLGVPPAASPARPASAAPHPWPGPAVIALPLHWRPHWLPAIVYCQVGLTSRGAPARQQAAPAGKPAHPAPAPAEARSLTAGTRRLRGRARNWRGRDAAPGAQGTRTAALSFRGVAGLRPLRSATQYALASGDSPGRCPDPRHCRLDSCQYSDIPLRMSTY